VYVDVIRERLSELLQEHGLAGEALEMHRDTLLREIESVIQESVTAGVVARRESAPADHRLAEAPGAEQSNDDAALAHEAAEAETAGKMTLDPQPEAPGRPTSAPAQVTPQAVAGRGEAEARSAAPPDENWLVKRDDGTMIADGRYLIRGMGTAEDPYTITWEHLLSAEAEYVPREGRNEIPRRIQMLHDKHVEITGYVAFPLLMDAADELLVMLNQWDGCCLGMPPTPYDAVEVRMKNLVTGNARMASYGTVRGTFKVEPHLIGGWLVGLYLMEDATLKPLAFGGFAP
jgi:hypothetical protein